MKSFFIFRFFETPSFDDEDMQRLSKVLHGLFISIGVAILIGLIGVFFVFEEKFFSTIALAVLFTAALTASILSKYGYIRAASILLLTTIWLTSLGLVAMSGGMRSLDIIFFITGTVLAGLLLGQRGTIYYGGASVFAGIVLLALDTLGVTLPNLFPFPAQTGLVLLLINLAILTPALNTTLNTLHHAIEEASQKIREQKKIQKELQISEEKFSKAFHASPMAIVIQRVRDLKYFDVNESFTRITGYSREEAQEHTINELNLYPDKQISLKLGKQVREQGFVRDFEIPFRRKNGDIGYGLVWGEPIDIDGEAMYIAGTVDITRRKELEILQSEQAQEISILYGALSKIAGKPDNVKSLTKQVAEIVVTDFHAYECALFLLSEDQSQAIQNAYCGPGIIAGEDCLSMESTSLITTAIKTGDIIYAPDVHKDTRYRADDSKTRSEFVVPLQAHGKVIGVINMESPNLDDFSERTRRLVATFAQNATLAIQNALLVDSLEVSLANLKESQARINFFLEHTAEGVYRIDYEPPISIHLPIEKQFKLSVEHGKIAECNEAFAKMYGLSTREEMIGKPYIEFYGEEGYEKNMEGNLDFMRQGYRIDDFETEEFNSKGEKVYFANNVIGIIRDGYFVSTWGTQRDITMLRKTITELERKNSELERFTYILWHELKSPLVTIRGFLGYLNKNVKLQKWEHVQSDLSRISQAADKMNYMIVNLLDILRAGHMMNVSEPITFQEIVQKSIASLQGNLDEHKIQVEINAEFPLICGDRERLSEVVEALVENAVKYMGNQPEPKITIGFRSEEGLKIFFIRDNGMGIDPVYHERIFNIFEKLNPTSEGTGVGLALAKRIIETHGGRIWVESKGEGTGSTFCFTLPEQC